MWFKPWGSVVKSMQEKTLSAALDLPRNTNLQTQRQSFNRKLNSMHVYLLQEIWGDFHGHGIHILQRLYNCVDWSQTSSTCLFILTIKLSLNHQAVSVSHYLFNLVIQFSENIVMNSTSGILTGLNIGGILYHDVLSISCNLGK